MLTCFADGDRTLGQGSSGKDVETTAYIKQQERQLINCVHKVWCWTKLNAFCMRLLPRLADGLSVRHWRTSFRISSNVVTTKYRVITQQTTSQWEVTEDDRSLRVLRRLLAAEPLRWLPWATRFDAGVFAFLLSAGQLPGWNWKVSMTPQIVLNILWSHLTTFSQLSPFRHQIYERFQWLLRLH